MTSFLPKLQLATHKNAVGVAIGATIGQAICTSIAVFGGSMLASKISQRPLQQSAACYSSVFPYNFKKCRSVCQTKRSSQPVWTDKELRMSGNTFDIFRSVKLLCDQHGNVAALHSRDCSVQSRHQKILNPVALLRSTSSSRSNSPRFLMNTSGSSKEDGYASSSDLSDDSSMFHNSHQSTLDKLYAWEKKNCTRKSREKVQFSPHIQMNARESHRQPRHRSVTPAPFIRCYNLICWKLYNLIMMVLHHERLIIVSSAHKEIAKPTKMAPLQTHEHTLYYALSELHSASHFTPLNNTDADHFCFADTP